MQASHISCPNLLLDFFHLLFSRTGLKKNQNAPRPSERCSDAVVPCFGLACDHEIRFFALSKKKEKVLR